MGWNRQCKQLRKKLFPDGKDRSIEREYKTDLVKTIDWRGHKLPRRTTTCRGMHRQYRLLKRLMRRKADGHE